MMADFLSGVFMRWPYLDVVDISAVASGHTSIYGFVLAESVGVNCVSLEH